MSMGRSTLAGLLALAAMSATTALPADAGASGGFFAYPAGATSSFGEPGSGEGQLQAPAGLAVDEASGDMYVADMGNNRVEVFTAEGAYVGQFDGSEAPSGPFSEPTSVAVDNTSGPLKGVVYVADPGHHVIDRFTPEGKYVAQLTGTCQAMGEPLPCPASKLITFGEVAGVAVDASGDLWVYEGKEEDETKATVDEIGATESLVGRVDTFRTVGPGFAVDSNGYSYTLQGNRIVAKLNAAHASKEGEVDLTKTATALAVDLATDNLLVDRGSEIAKYGPGGEPFTHPVETFGTEGLSESDGVAVDAATGTVYAAERGADAVEVFQASRPVAPATVEDQPPSVSSITRTSALVSGTIDPGATDTLYQVEAVDAAEYESAAADPYVNGSRSASFDAGSGSVDVPAGPVTLTGLLAGTTYHYRLSATNQTGTTYGADHTLTTAPATPPIVTTGAASEVTQTGVLLSGTVDTRELQTSYEFEVGVDTSYGGAKLFGNAGRGGVEAVSEALLFLIPGTTYHYRLVASNEDGTTYGQDMTFTTPGVPALISQPATEALIPSPTVAFPSVAGAITKAQGAHKHAKKRRKTAASRRRRGHKQGSHRRGAKRGGGKRK